MSLPAKPYYRYFKHLNEDTIRTVKEITLGISLDTFVPPFTGSIWRASETEGFSRFKLLVDTLSLHYRINKPTISKGSREVYYTMREHIEIPRVSLISFLHEYRHHMQFNNIQHYNDKEEDARGWSISLFAQAMPNKFDKAWKEYLIWYLPPYSANWRQEVGL